jgi:hypothetical protein
MEEHGFGYLITFSSNLSGFTIRKKPIANRHQLPAGLQIRQSGSIVSRLQIRQNWQNND